MALLKYFQPIKRPVEEPHSALGSENEDFEQNIPAKKVALEPEPSNSRSTVNQHQDIHDISHYSNLNIRSCMPDSTKYHLLKNVFHPEYSYMFPTKLEYNKNRAFQYAWLQKFPWLVYSVEVNGGFCINCILFGQVTDGSASDLGVLTSRPLVNFTKAMSILSEHSTKATHLTATTKASDFLSVMEGGQQPIRQQIHHGLASRIRANCAKLASIIKIIILCGRQNLPLRSNKDNITELEKNPSANHGNFWALAGFRVEAGDTTLEKHLKTAAANATYTSADIQNQIISIVGDHIHGQIVDMVKTSPVYSIIADEVTDASNKEQLSLVLR